MKPAPFAEALRVWLKIGLLSFGGPAGQIALMHRLLVEEKGWISETRFLHALNYCMLLPGPEAQQLATYVGWLLHRTLGGIVAGVLFVLPGFLLITAIAVAYVLYGELHWMQGLLFGMQAATLAIVVEAVMRVGRKALRHPALYAVAAAAFVAIFAFGVPFPLIVAAAGLIGLAGHRLAPRVFRVGKPQDGAAADDPGPEHARPSTAWTLRVLFAGAALWGLPVLLLLLSLGAGHVFTQEAVFFSKMAVVTFGGAYAVLAYMTQQAVDRHGWLAPGEMVQGLALAETTPGPLILVLTVQRKPDRQVQDHTDDGRGDAGQRRGQPGVAAQPFHVRRAQEDPQEARHEADPGRQAGAEHAREQRRQRSRLAPGREKADIGQHQDQRSGRRFREREAL